MATIYGDTAGTLEAKAKGQILLGKYEDNNVIYGDAFVVENGKGGNDVLIGGGNSVNNLYGDAETMSYSRAAMMR